MAVEARGVRTIEVTAAATVAVTAVAAATTATNHREAKKAIRRSVTSRCMRT